MGTGFMVTAIHELLAVGAPSEMLLERSPCPHGGMTENFSETRAKGCLERTPNTTRWV